MKCSRCGSDNREGIKFCEECGAELQAKCPNCNAEILTLKNFCGECGYQFKPAKHTPADSEADSRPVAPPDETPPDDAVLTAGERKYVTTLFTDITGYTIISERLDPEEVKEMTTQIFDDISKIIRKLDGFIEKFAGDAVMALFGATIAHEDDPIRAILAAREIHSAVESYNPRYEKRIGQPLSMHTGINTGLVVTGDVNLEKGTHGVAGDPINVATRLSTLAGPGEILVGQGTYSQAGGYFVFEQLKPARIKGKTKPISVYKVLSQKNQPVKTHRLQGVRAELIGRTAEMVQLSDAYKNLEKGIKTVFLTCGAAGTGKSRLIEEFKATLDLDTVQWLEGHAYPYAQNVPYFPLIDLVKRALLIEESDPPEKIKQKIQAGIEFLNIDKKSVEPYLGSLLALNYPEINRISPESWKLNLQKAIEKLLTTLSEKAPTIICLEDLHWADSSSLELIRLILSEFRSPTMFLCAYRPIVSILSPDQKKAIGPAYNKINLQDLSLSETQDMVESLLKTGTIPNDLRRFIADKAGGNPFYLEELINSLIESKTLLRHNDSWEITRSFDETHISSTVHGIISSRIDRLEKNTKHILQEASVIGRAFFYDILDQITDFPEKLDQSLSSLEQLDLIKTKSIQPDLEFIFKHALTQEVVYNGLLIKERQEMHERIALVIERLFEDRISEFFETLANHFIQGRSYQKAIYYLIKSGEKSLGKYALEESHQYFKQAFELMSRLTGKTKDDQRKTLRLLINWALVYNYRGDFSGLYELLTTHEKLAASQAEGESAGMFFAWLGWAMQRREKLRESYRYLQKSLKIGEKIENFKIIGYSCAWLSHTCSDLGLLDEALEYSDRAREISDRFRSDQDLFRFTMAGRGLAYYFRGDCNKAIEVGKTMLEYGDGQSDIRSVTIGYRCMGWGYLAAGNFALATEHFKMSIQVSPDPLLSYISRLMLGWSYLSNGQLPEAENTLEEAVRFGETHGFEQIETSAQGMLGIILVSKGSLSRGIKILTEINSRTSENEIRYRYAAGVYMMGKIYLQLALRAGPKSVSMLTKNMGFLLKNVPIAGRKASAYLDDTIKLSKEIGAKSILGQACLDKGLLYNARKLKDRARKSVLEAIEIFEQSEAEMHLKKAREVLASLE